MNEKVPRSLSAYACVDHILLFVTNEKNRSFSSNQQRSYFLSRMTSEGIVGDIIHVLTFKYFIFYSYEYL